MQHRRTACKRRGWHVANVWCKTKRSRGAVEALALLLAALQISLAEVRVCFAAMANPIHRKRRRNILVDDLFLYAHSFHKAAQALAGSLRGGDPVSDVGLSPVVYLYRHALELHLKAILLGDGGNFLATRPDRLSIYKTHSVTWLGQFVCQIVTGVGWQREFRCEGIENLEDFKPAVGEMNSVDPGSYAFQLPGETEAKGAFDVRGFATKMDALLELLNSTADGLAAEWDLRSGTVTLESDGPGGGFEPTIQRDIDGW